MTATKGMKLFRFGIIYQIKHGLSAKCKFTDWLVRPRKVSGPQSSALRVIYSQSDQPVRKLAYCPQGHVLFVNQLKVQRVYKTNKKFSQIEYTNKRAMMALKSLTWSGASLNPRAFI
jgi:hypothetical protein